MSKASKRINKKIHNVHQSVCVCVCVCGGGCFNYNISFQRVLLQNYKIIVPPVCTTFIGYITSKYTQQDVLKYIDGAALLERWSAPNPPKNDPHLQVPYSVKCLESRKGRQRGNSSPSHSFIISVCHTHASNVLVSLVTVCLLYTSRCV